VNQQIELYKKAQNLVTEQMVDSIDQKFEKFRLKDTFLEVLSDEMKKLYTFLEHVDDALEHMDEEDSRYKEATVDLFVARDLFWNECLLLHPQYQGSDWGFTIRRGWKLVVRKRRKD